MSTVCSVDIHCFNCSLPIVILQDKLQHITHNNLSWDLVLQYISIHFYYTMTWMQTHHHVQLISISPQLQMVTFICSCFMSSFCVLFSLFVSCVSIRGLFVSVVCIWHTVSSLMHLSSPVQSRTRLLRLLSLSTPLKSHPLTQNLHVFHFYLKPSLGWCHHILFLFQILSTELSPIWPLSFLQEFRNSIFELATTDFWLNSVV